MSLDKLEKVCRYELDPETKTTLLVCPFKTVKNVETVRKNVLNGSWKCAIVKPAMIIDPIQVAVAANKAVISAKYKTMTTRNVYAEILFNLSITKNISQSLSKFGIEEETEILVCFLISAETDCSQEILPQIDGELCHMSGLAGLRDLEKIKTAYKLGGLKCDSDLQDMLNIILTRMVTKNIMSH